jgi:hypothetical protein
MAIVPCFRLSYHASKAFSLIYVVSDSYRTMLRKLFPWFTSWQIAIVLCFESFFLDLRRDRSLSYHASKTFSLIYVVSFETIDLPGFADDSGRSIFFSRFVEEFSNMISCCYAKLSLSCGNYAIDKQIQSRSVWCHVRSENWKDIQKVYVKPLLRMGDQEIEDRLKSLSVVDDCQTTQILQLSEIPFMQKEIWL